MSSSTIGTPEPTGTAPDRARAPRRLAPSWGLALTAGLLLIAGGAFALFTSVLTSFVSVLMLGSLLFVVGILEIVSAFRVRHAGPFAAYLLAGILSLVVGGLFVVRPVESLASLTLLIGGYFLACGLFRGITAIVDRYRSSGWDLLYSFVAIALGVAVMAMWPLSSLWVVGTLVATEILARGAALVAAALAMRARQRQAAGAPG